MEIQEKLFLSHYNIKPMKFLLLLFITVSLPVFLLLTTIVTSSDISPILKSDLKQHKVYTQLSKQLTQLDANDTDSAILNAFMQKKFTPGYIQNKVETAMDSSTDWIEGKTQTPPVISFKDIKDDLTAQYPDLLPSIEQTAQQLQEQQAQDGTTNQTDEQTIKSAQMLANLAKSDFTIKLNTYLSGLKNFYSFVKIFQPILGILLALSIMLLGFLNKSWKGRFTWIGITLLLSGIWGFVLAFSNIAIVQLLTNLASNNTNQIVNIASPVILQIMNHYVDMYVNYQKIISLVFLLAAAGCFVGVALSKDTPLAPVKVKATKKK